jgi:hypothetical protein
VTSGFLGPSLILRPEPPQGSFQVGEAGRFALWHRTTLSLRTTGLGYTVVAIDFEDDVAPSSAVSASTTTRPILVICSPSNLMFLHSFSCSHLRALPDVRQSWALARPKQKRDLKLWIRAEILG